MSETEKAVREAWADLWTPGNPTSVTEAAVDAAIRADERAKLCAAVPPMTMTVEDEVQARRLADVRDGQHAAAYIRAHTTKWAFAELDATRAALAARDALVATLTKERDEARARESAAWLERDNKVAALRAKLAALVEAADAYRVAVEALEGALGEDGFESLHDAMQVSWTAFCAALAAAKEGDRG